MERKLAKCVGMDYALMSGGDVGPLGSDAVTQIHSLFMWAKVSGKGVLLFIDEAEAFLLSRSKSTMSESAHNALNALLYNTGGESNILLVLATNRYVFHLYIISIKLLLLFIDISLFSISCNVHVECLLDGSAQDLDAAILDRCDESLYFPLPNESCRKTLMSLYFNKYVREKVVAHNTSARSKWGEIKSRISRTKQIFLKIQSDTLNEGQLLEAASMTTGFSGREIGKLMLAIQSILYSSRNGELTINDIRATIEIKVNEHSDKQLMMKPPDEVISNIHSKQVEHRDDREECEFEFGKRKNDPKRYSYHRYGSFGLR